MYMYMDVCIVTQFRVSRIRLPVKADTGDSSEEIRIRVPDDWLEKSMGYDVGAGDWRLEIWRFGGWRLRFCCCCGTGTGTGLGLGLGLDYGARTASHEDAEP